MVKQQHQLFVSLLALVDGLVVVAACVLALLMRWSLAEQYIPTDWETWVKRSNVIFAVPIVLYMMGVFGLYRPRRDRSIWPEQAAILRVSVIAAIVLALGLRTSKGNPRTSTT